MLKRAGEAQTAVRQERAPPKLRSELLSVEDDPPHRRRHCNTAATEARSPRVAGSFEGRQDGPHERNAASRKPFCTALMSMLKLARRVLSELAQVDMQEHFDASSGA